MKKLDKAWIRRQAVLLNREIGKVSNAKEFGTKAEASKLVRSAPPGSKNSIMLRAAQLAGFYVVPGRSGAGRMNMHIIDKKPPTEEKKIVGDALDYGDYDVNTDGLMETYKADNPMGSNLLAPRHAGAFSKELQTYDKSQQGKIGNGYVDSIGTYSNGEPESVETQNVHGFRDTGGLLSGHLVSDQFVRIMESDPRERIGKYATVWLGFLSFGGSIIATAKEIVDLLEADSPLLKDADAGAQGIFRVMFVARSADLPQQPVPIERILEGAKFIDTLYNNLYRHPVWNEKEQKSGLFETEATLDARLISAMDQNPGLVTVEEMFSCCEALRHFRNQQHNPCWNYYYRTVGSHDRLSGGNYKKFLEVWLASGFARLHVGHKLAAALALTDAPDMPLHSPWKGWSLVIPDGFFENITRDQAIHETDGLSTAIISLKRAWFIGTEMVCVIGDNSGTQGGSAVIWMEQIPKVLGEHIAEMVRNLGMGAIAAMENHPAKSRGQWGASRSKINLKRLDAPAVGASYELAAPITIDLRDDLKRAIKGKRSGKGSIPKAYWVVCGHWKQQVHGPKRGLRKKIWIQPYHKGDPSLKVLMRITEVKE